MEKGQGEYYIKMMERGISLRFTPWGPHISPEYQKWSKKAYIYKRPKSATQLLF